VGEVKALACSLHESDKKKVLLPWWEGIEGRASHSRIALSLPSPIQGKGKYISLNCPG
jgi:hypothetical protein